MPRSQASHAAKANSETPQTNRTASTTALSKPAYQPTAAQPPVSESTPDPTEFLHDTLEQKRELVLKKVRQLLTKDLPEDVLKELTQYDVYRQTPRGLAKVSTYRLTPEGLAKASTWKTLETTLCEQAADVATLARRFTEPNAALQVAKTELSSWEAKILQDNTSSIAVHVCTIILERWELGVDHTRRVLEDKLHDAIREAEIHIPLPIGNPTVSPADGLKQIGGSKTDREQELEEHARKWAMIKLSDPSKYPRMSAREVAAALGISRQAVYDHPELERITTGIRRYFWATDKVKALRDS